MTQTSTAATHSPVTTVLLVRHARSTANTAGILAGRSPGVALDDAGRDQAAQLIERLRDVPIRRIVSSPLDRCLQTVTPLAQERGIPVDTDPDLAEVDYGAWTGQSLKDLSGRPEWATVQQQPSAMVFPEGESMPAMAARVAAAVRRIAATGGGPVLVCSHGDPIAAVLADALGMHFDSFQRLAVRPASLSVVRYGPHRPQVVLMGETGSLDLVRGEAPGDYVPGGPASADAVSRRPHRGQQQDADSADGDRSPAAADGPG